MRKFYIVFLLLTICLNISACGYRILGLNNKTPVKFYIERVENNTIDTQFGDIVQETLNKYFIKYGEMASYGNATYFLNVSLSSIKFNTDISTATDEAVTENAVLELQIVVNDVNGAEVFSRKYTPSTAFGISSSISASLSSRRAAIAESVKTSLDDFRNAFNSKVL